MEIWKDIKNYEGFYQVSSFGNVKRLSGSPHCKKDRLLVLKTKKSGYKFVCFSKGEKEYKYFHVHRLVAEAFISNIENKPCVNHKNCIKHDNNVQNLEWCTVLENNRHARKNVSFKSGSKLGFLNSKSTPIIQKNIQGDMLYIWADNLELSKFYKISKGTVSTSILRGIPCVGYTWERTTKEFYILNKDK